ncbi:MAG: DUF554 domain-containing protein [Sphaerochaetaceae bacterium]
MIATYINALAVVLGSLVGLFIGKRLNEQFKELIFISSGIVTLVIGVQMALMTNSFLVLLFAIAIGGFVGYLIGIEDAILSLGHWMEKKTSYKTMSDQGANGSFFARGFLSASVLFCSGAMTVLGSISAGTTGDYTLLLIKSVMDGSMAIVFAAAYGPGVMGAAVVVLVYQGFFTLAGRFLAPLMGESGLAELSASGGILLIMIAFNLLKMKEFKTGNFIPALLFAPLLSKVGALIVSALPFLQ